MHFPRLFMSAFLLALAVVPMLALAAGEVTIGNLCQRVLSIIALPLKSQENGAAIGRYVRRSS